MTTRIAELRGDELIAQRRLHASPERVWSALTRPASLAAFWGGVHATVPSESVTVDLRVGGGFALETRAPDGSTHRLRFVYRRLAEPEVMTFDEPATGIRTTITLQRTGEHTRITVHQRRLPHELQSEQAVEGLASTLDALAAHVNGPYAAR